MKQLKLGLIGVGRQGKIHLRNCLRLKEARLVGVADTSKGALEFAKKEGVKDVYTNYEDLFNSEQIDAVIISLPNFLHLDSAVKAAEAGKDILLEKPLARNLEEGEKILSSVKKNGVELMVGYPLRFDPVISEIRKKIIDGFFGKVQIVDAVNISQGPFTQNYGVGPRPVSSWWFDRQLAGGGALLDLGSHLINLLTWYFGDVENVNSYLGHVFNLELEDFATCVLKFKDGPVAVVNAGWFSKDSTLSIHVCGTAKSFWAHISHPNKLSIIWGDIKRKFGVYGPFLIELKYFVDCLNKDVSPSPSGEEALLDLQIISTAYNNASKLVNGGD